MEFEKEIKFDDIKQGNLDAYEELFHLYYPQLVRFAEGILFDPYQAEDVVQNLFLYLWERMDTININTSLKSYLYRSVHNRCLNKIKELQIIDNNHLLYQEGLINSGNENSEANPEIERKIEQALKKLPLKMVEIVKLKYLENKKLKEIAADLNVSENTVKTQLLRAKAKLRSLINTLILLLLTS
ncbi:MAG: RNA polymerase sigma-70 factor [Cyclobacteriaceae bacterium]